MTRFIVKPLFHSQQLQQCDASRREKQVRADYDQHNGYEKHHHSCHRIFCENGYGVSCQKAHKPCRRQHPFGLRLLFTCSFAGQQLYRIRFVHPAYRAEEYEQKNYAEQPACFGDSGRGNVKSQRYGCIQQIQDNEIHQLIQQHPCHQPEDHRNQKRIQRLKKYHSGYVPLFHTEYVVQPELALPPPDKKAVDIKQEYHCKYCNYHLSHAHVALQDVASPEAPQLIIVPQRADNVKNSCRHDAGKHVRYEGFAVVSDVGECHAYCQFNHGDHLRSP